MELSKKGIDRIHLKSKNRKYYYCEDVDEVLDEIANAVDAQQKGMESLKELEKDNKHLRHLVESHQSELSRLKQIENESPDSNEQVARMLLSADKVIEQLVEEGKSGIKEEREEREELEQEKAKLQSEIEELQEQQREFLTNLKQEVWHLMNRLE